MKFTVPKKCNYYQNKGSPPSGIADLSRFWLSCLGLLVYLLPKTIKFVLAFKYFDYERYSRNVSCVLNLISTISLFPFAFPLLILNKKHNIFKFPRKQINHWTPRFGLHIIDPWGLQMCKLKTEFQNDELSHSFLYFHTFF